MFLYYLAGSKKQALTIEEARAAGLGHAFDDAGGGPRAAPTRKGPDGKAGLLVATPAATGKVLFDPAAQAWRRVPGSDLWVGLPNGATVRPEQLARRERFDGQPVELADGQAWLIPRLVGVLEHRPSSVPRRFDLDEAGEPVVTVHERYRDLVERAWPHWLEFVGELGEQPAPTVKDSLDLAADALALNYRLSRFEAIAVLRLFDTAALTRVRRALIDADAIEADLAARAGPGGKPDAGGSSETAGGSTTSSGEAAGSATTT